MKLFQVRDIHIPAITIIADDVHHANHIFFMALYRGLGHFPKGSFTVENYEPVHAKQTETMKQWAQEHKAGIVHRCNDGGWELIPPRDDE